MAMAGVGCCRAPSGGMGRSAALMRLGQCAPAAEQAASWRRRSGASASVCGAAKKEESWRAGFLGSVLGLGAPGRGAAMEAVGRSAAQRLCVRAINVSGPGSVDSPLMQSMQAKIKGDLNAESVSVKDAYGDGRHVSIDVVASVFEGKSAVNRQRMVYKAIWEELQATVHAVDQLKTRTPSEAANSPDPL